MAVSASLAQTHITPEHRIRIKQQKTGRELLIPLHRDTIEALDALDMQHIVIVTTAYGKPFTVDGFSGWMRDAISEAGLPLDCKPHGLRKAAGRLLAEAGATAKMIIAILMRATSTLRTPAQTRSLVAVASPARTGCASAQAYREA
jgi:enterobacteria phage integrase